MGTPARRGVRSPLVMKPQSAEGSLRSMRAIQGPPGCLARGAQPSSGAARKSVPVSPARGIRGPNVAAASATSGYAAFCKSAMVLSERPGSCEKAASVSTSAKGSAAHTREANAAHMASGRARARKCAARGGGGRDKTDDKSNITSVPFRCGDESSCANYGIFS